MHLSGEFARNSCRSAIAAARANRLTVPFIGFRLARRILARAHVAQDGPAILTVRSWRPFLDCPEIGNSESTETGEANMMGARLGTDARETLTSAGPERSTAPVRASAVPRQVTDGIAKIGQSVFRQRS